MSTLLNRTRISTKLLVSSLCFSLPIAVLFYFVISGINYDIHFSTLEIYGNRYQRHLEQLMSEIPMYQLASLWKGSGDNPFGAASERSDAVEQALAELTKEDKAIGKDLQFTDEGLGKRNRGHLRITTLRSKWENLKSTPSWNGVMSMVNDIREMITHSGDTSNLILDPDLDSYYMMDITLLALPQSQQRLDEIIHYGLEALEQKTLSSGQRLQFTVSSTLLDESDLRRIKTSAEASLNEDPNFYGVSSSLASNLRPAMDNYLNATQNLIELLKIIADSPEGSVSRETFLESALQAREASYTLWNLCVRELDLLLEKRIQSYKTDRMVALSATGGALVLALLLVYFIAVSIINPIRRIQGYTRGITRGNLDAKMQGTFSGELGHLSEDVQSMVATLKAKLAAEAKSEELERETKRALEAIQEAELARSKAQQVERYQKREIHELTEVLKEIARGNLTARYTATEGEEDSHEAWTSFVDLEKALNATIHNLASLIHKIQNDATLLATSANDISTVSTSLHTSSEDMSRQAENVAGATEQISMNINAMASAAEEMSVNVTTVSNTARQMAQRMNSVVESVDGMRKDIESIGDNAEDGAAIAARAMSMASTATESMNQLGEAAQQIGKVTEVIKRIAEQTNLLALNATIEAASAGDAGKGFAVVAHEIKELANQSAKAAEDIASKIEGVQLNTQDAVKVISQVTDIINTINDASSTITAAVEKQTLAANDISDYVSEATRGVEEISVSISELAKGANDMSQNAGEMAKGANEVASNILVVSKLAGNSTDGAKQTNALAEKLTDLSRELDKLISHFNAGDA